MIDHLLHYLGRGFLAVFTKKVTLTRTAERSVSYFNCSRVFQYHVQATAYGLVFRSLCDDETYRRAERDAERRLKRMLERDVVPTPCPHCGRYQQDMTASLRRREVVVPLVIGLILAALLLALALQGYGEPGLSRRLSWRFLLEFPWNV